MNIVIGWIALIGFIVALTCSFAAWWKLRKLYELLNDESSEEGQQMPLVKPFFGSYRKGLLWLKEHQNEIPAQLKPLSRHTLIFDKLAIILAVFLFVFAAINTIASI